MKRRRTASRLSSAGLSSMLSVGRCFGVRSVARGGARFFTRASASASASAGADAARAPRAPRAPRSTLRSVGRWTWRSAAAAALGAGAYVWYFTWREANPRPQIPQSPTFPNGSKRKTLVILGSGWGSISLLKKLDTKKYNVVVVSPRNYFLFTPLLPSTPVGTVELKSIIDPVRNIARRTRGEVHYYEAEATDIDPVNRTVHVRAVADGNYDLDLKYDYLVVGVGAQPTTFGIPGVLENSSFLKEISDAQEIRTKIMANIERAAALAPSDPERKRLLNFVVVGGGPTGVEFAAELKDYVNQDLRKWMPGISEEIEVTLVEAMPNILNMFDKSLIKYAQDMFTKEKIHLKLDTRVQNVNKTTITALNSSTKKTESYQYGLLVWATGNAPREIAKKLMSKLEAQTSPRGLLINEKLQVLGAEDSIYGIGDCTFYPGLFPTAQVAHQEGEYLAHHFTELYEIDQLQWKLQKNGEPISGKTLDDIKSMHEKLPNFEYNHKGALAYIGSDKAIADLAVGEAKYRLAGSFTFFFWKYAYLAMCLSFKNRILVAMDWCKVYFLGRDSSV